MSPSIIDILERLDKSGLEALEAEIKHHEYRIRQLKNEWDKAYSILLNRARAEALKEGIIVG